jgi:uncharacterized membrane protein
MIGWFLALQMSIATFVLIVNRKDVCSRWTAGHNISAVVFSSMMLYHFDLMEEFQTCIVVMHILLLTFVGTCVTGGIAASTKEHKEMLDRKLQANYEIYYTERMKLYEAYQKMTPDEKYALSKRWIMGRSTYRYVTSPPVDYDTWYYRTQRGTCSIGPH